MIEEYGGDALANLSDAGARDDYEHGRGAWRDDVHLPEAMVTREFMRAQGREDDWKALARRRRRGI